MTETTDGIDWEAANGRFLAAALAWIRLLLRRRLDEPGVIATQPPKRSWRHRDEYVPDSRPAKVTDADVAEAAAEMAEAEQISPPPALAQLAERLGLTRFERDTLLLCAAVELDPAVGPLCARVHGDEQRRSPTFGLALAVLPNPAWEVVSPHASLRFWRLIEITQRSGDGIIAAALGTDERIVNYLKGLNHLDDRLTPLVTHLDAVPDPLPPSQQRVADEFAAHWSTPAAPVVQLAGVDPEAKKLLAARAATDCGFATYQLPAHLLPTAPVELDDLARLWDRESALLPLALYVDAEDIDESGPERPPIERFLTRLSGRCVLGARESWSNVGRPSVVLDVDAPTPAERVVAWRESLAPATDPGAIDALATQFALEDSDIRTVARTAGGDPEAAWRACRARTRPRMDALAQRLEPRVGWDDIVLPESVAVLLRQVADQVQHRTAVYEQWGFGERVNRGLGMSVLFAGPSGTGKTMAAEVLAAQLNLDLYRIDLSAVVSKYIGETEKNLRRLFDGAEGGGSILFLDEADALCGTRSEVKDSHDRYANIEVNYLLQRMETYRGLAILATNLRSALDPALMRRLRFVVDFPFPGVEERKAIWQKSFPSAAPAGGLDFDRLARLPVSGGMVRNIAVNAAFLAAADGTDITMRQTLAAARTEFEKLELPIRDRDFATGEVTAP